MQPLIYSRMKTFRTLLWLCLGSVIAALSYAAFQVPYGIAAGGISGLVIIFADINPLPVGVTIWLLNIPMLWLGYHYLGRWAFVGKTLVAITVFSVSSDIFLALLPGYADQWPLTDNVLLAAIYGGVLGGVGLGIVFAAGSSLGGTGVVGRILQNRWGVPLSSIYLYTDGGIIALAGIMLGWESALYAMITLFLYGVASDYVQEGPSSVRTAFIVTGRPTEMTQGLIQALGRGATYWDVVGGYSGESRAVVFCTVHRPQVSLLRDVVRRVDPTAFLTIGISHQAYGGGFNVPEKMTDNAKPGEKAS